MPKPMKQKNYYKLVLKIANITEENAQETMAVAVTDLRQQCQMMIRFWILCDGTWQRRRFS